MLSILHVVHFLAMCAELGAVSLILAVGLDFLYYEYVGEGSPQHERAVTAKHSLVEMMAQEKLRREQEALQNEGFFEESSVPGVDADGILYHNGEKVPTTKALTYFKVKHELVDATLHSHEEL